MILKSIRFSIMALNLLTIVISCKSGPGIDLLTAIDQENISVVQQHIDAGSDLNNYPIPEGLPFAGAHPIHLAVLKGNGEIIKLLLDNGAKIDLEADNKDKATPLHWAAFFNQKEMVSLLIEAGAPINALDATGGTPLDSAAFAKKLTRDSGKLELLGDIIVMLKENGGSSASFLKK